MFDGADFRSFADSCAHQFQSEAAERTAIGRSYYAAFLIVRDRLKTNHQVTITKDGAHRQVVQALLGINRTVGQEYQRLRKLREAADYDVYYRNSATDVQDALDLCDFVINNFR